MKMTITFDPENCREMSDCIGVLHLLMDAASHDAQHGQKVIDSLAPFLSPRVMRVLPDIVRREGITSKKELECLVGSGAALLKSSYGLGAKSRRELCKAIVEVDRAEFARLVADCKGEG